MDGTDAASGYVDILEQEEEDALDRRSLPKEEPCVEPCVFAVPRSGCLSRGVVSLWMGYSCS